MFRINITLAIHMSKPMQVSITVGVSCDNGGYGMEK